MKYWVDEETGINFYEPDCADEWLDLISAVGFDYDGYNTVENLKGLVDELIEMAHNARKCLWENKLLGEHGSPDDKIDAQNRISQEEPQ